MVGAGRFELPASWSRDKDAGDTPVATVQNGIQPGKTAGYRSAQRLMPHFKTCDGDDIDTLSNDEGAFIGEKTGAAILRYP